jgi:hypothetical protein
MHKGNRLAQALQFGLAGGAGAQVLLDLATLFGRHLIIEVARQQVNRYVRALRVPIW